MRRTNLLDFGSMISSERARWGRGSTVQSKEVSPCLSWNKLCWNLISKVFCFNQMFWKLSILLELKQVFWTSIQSIIVFLIKFDYVKNHVQGYGARRGCPNKQTSPPTPTPAPTSLTWKTVPGEAALVSRVSQTRAHPCTSRSRSWVFCCWYVSPSSSSLASLQMKGLCVWYVYKQGKGHFTAYYGSHKAWVYIQYIQRQAQRGKS